MDMSKLALLGGNPVFERLLDWSEIWPPIDDPTSDRLMALYRSRRWTAFDETEADFSKSFAAHHDTKHGIFMINGTVTLQCALGAHGIGVGDEVIVPSLTWYATAMAAHYVGAKPVFVDVDRETLCIDPEKIEAAITERTKAIVPVHLYGSMADMDKIMAIARSHKLRVIEDCAHAHGGVWDGKRVGSIGDVGSFSFQQSKTMASAEGGICITNDADIAERIYRMKHIGYGPSELQGKAVSAPPADLLCYPFRATAFQAVILDEQLKTLDARLDRYRQAARYLEDRLSQSTQIRFQKPGRRAVKQGYFGWVMIFDHPSYSDLPLSAILEAMNAEGLQAMATWDPVYRFILFNLRSEHYRISQECSETERLVPRIAWLLHPILGLNGPDLERVADVIEKVVGDPEDLRKYAIRKAG